MSDGVVKYPWYGLVAGAELEQGDILLDCPVFLIPPSAVAEAGPHEITIEYQNAIVMTQSCDLAVRADGTCNAEEVILAAIYFQRELQQDRTFGKKANWENACKGRFPRYHVLNRCEIQGHELDYMLVDMGRLFALSTPAVREFAAEGNKNRVRLLPPYREHLSEAFARFFVRVGLPVDIPAFK